MRSFPLASAGLQPSRPRGVTPAGWIVPLFPRIPSPCDNTYLCTVPCECCCVCVGVCLWQCRLSRREKQWCRKEPGTHEDLRVCNFRSKFCLLFCGCGIRWGMWDTEAWNRVKVKLMCTWQPPPWLPTLPLFPPWPHPHGSSCFIRCRILLDLVRKKHEQPIPAHQLDSGICTHRLQLWDFYLHPHPAPWGGWWNLQFVPPR